MGRISPLVQGGQDMGLLYPGIQDFSVTDDDVGSCQTTPGFGAVGLGLGGVAAFFQNGSFGQDDTGGDDSLTSDSRENQFQHRGASFAAFRHNSA